MKQKYFIDSQKLVTGIFVLALMAVFHQLQNPTAWVYLALHGTYGTLWVMKGRIFPDRSWEQSCSLAYGLVIWAGLCLYWVAPWLIMSQGIQTPAWYLGMCVFLYAMGVFLHFSADMQKYIALKEKPGHLITDGLFSRVRNMNYFGELLIYSGFGLLAMHWLPLLILLAWVFFVWTPRMLRKDRSLSRYPEFADYRARTKLFIPFLF
jgi:protein-S-isoprenylcysteine O-methyltransferase Ste14